jgi:tetratricopeptide (TPR) repeat protein
MESNNTSRGLQLFELGKYAKAIQYFQNALTENISDIEAKYYLAFSLLCTKEFKKSETILLEILEKNAENEYVIFLLAKNKYFSKNIKEAEDLVNTAISINPNEADFFGIKAYIYIAKKESQKAIETAKEGLKIEPENELCLNALINETGKLKLENSSNINSLLNLNPEDAFSQANIGFSKLRNHKNEEALEHFKVALSLNPNLAIARNGMVAALKVKNTFLIKVFAIPLFIKKLTFKNPINFILGIFTFLFIISQIYYYENFSFLLIPVTTIYLYIILGSWLFEPASNAKVIFHKYVKYLLTKGQKYSGITFIIFFILSLVSFSCFLLTKNYAFLLSSFGLISSLITISKFFLIDIRNAKTFSFTFSLFYLLISSIAFFYPNKSLWLGIIIFVTLIIYTRNLNDIK